jgi:hypothetical protein
MMMMRCGVVDVEPFLVSRNTLGNGKTANSKSQMSNVKMVVAGMRWWFCGNAMMGFGVCNVEVAVMVVVDEEAIIPK